MRLVLFWFQDFLLVMDASRYILLDKYCDMSCCCWTPERRYSTPWWCWAGRSFSTLWAWVMEAHLAAVSTTVCETIDKYVDRTVYSRTGSRVSALVVSNLWVLTCWTRVNVIDILFILVRKWFILTKALNLPCWINCIASCTGFESGSGSTGFVDSLSRRHFVSMATAITRASSSKGDHNL